VTAAKTERLMNLLIMLLVQRHPVGKDRIREILYPDLASDEAFEKKFERDKDDLRSLGIPVEVGHLDGYFEDEFGYRVRPDAFALPDVDLEPDEAAVVGLATRVWQQERLAAATTGALRKLTAAGVEVDPARLDIAAPRPGADEPSFEVLFEALTERRRVEFDYARPGEPPRTRRLEPWGITRWSGRWYVVGRDLDRDAERVFRLSRVVGEARPVGDPGAYVIPADVDVAATARRLAPAPSEEPAVLLVRTGTGRPVRRLADDVETGVPGPDGSTGWDRVTLHRPPTALADEVLALGEHVVVLSPPALRAEVVDRLRAIVDAEVAS